MDLFDTHFHFYKDDGAVLEYAGKARAAGVRYLLAVGANFDESRTARDFSAQTPDCWFSAGVHPHEASKFSTDISMFNEFLAEPKLSAIGEVGLDYFYENSERELQKKVFQSFATMALENNLPLIVHCRDKQDSEKAFEDSYLILSGFAGKGGRFVLHCFTGTPGWCVKFLGLGAFVSVGGIITFPKAENVRGILKVIPEERLLLETDSPYLAPVPHRGSRNHPGYLPVVARFIAGQKGLCVEDIARQTTANALEFFKLKGIAERVN